MLYKKLSGVALKKQDKQTNFIVAEMKRIQEAIGKLFTQKNILDSFQIK